MALCWQVLLSQCEVEAVEHLSITQNDQDTVFFVFRILENLQGSCHFCDVRTDNVKTDLREISCEVNYAYTELAQVRIQVWAFVL